MKPYDVIDVVFMEERDEAFTLALHEILLQHRCFPTSLRRPFQIYQLSS
jgi:hypothetical protein